MRILFWLSIGLDRRTPSEHLLKAMIKALYEKGNSVHVLQKDTLSGDKHLYPELEKLGVQTTCFKSPQAVKNQLIARYMVDIKYVNKCKKWIAQHGGEFDCVFLQSSNVAGFQTRYIHKKFPNLRIVFNVQDIFPSNAKYAGKMRESSIVYRVISVLQSRAYKDAEQIITISEDMKDELLSLGVEKNKLHVVYNWSYTDQLYDPAAMENTTIRKMLRTDKFNVVYAGNIGMMQNVEIVINAAKQIKDDSVHFHIFGDGLYKEKLVKTAEGLKNVSFWPMQPASLAPSIYCMADVNVIPLAKGIFRTALPSKTATCLACQKPVILAIGEQSKFGKRVASETNCACIESNDSTGLVDEINRIKNMECTYRTGEFFKKYMSITRNSAEYVYYMTGIAN